MSDGPQSENELLVVARDHVAGGQTEAALETLQEILLQDPTCVPAYALRGECYLALGDAGRAYADLQRALSLGPSRPEPYLLKALAEHHAGKLQESCESLQQAESKGGDGRVSFLLARTLEELGDDLDAADAYGRAFAADFGNTEALDARGRILMRHQYYVAALADFSTCCLLEPSVAQYRVNRGNAFYELGELDRASRDYREAMKLDQSLAEVSLNLGCIALDEDDLVHAIQHFNHALSLDPSYARAYLNRGLAYYHNGNDERAENDLRLARDLDPSDPDSTFGLARLFARQRRYMPAVEMLIKALESAPEYLEDVDGDDVFDDLKKLQVVREAVAQALDRLVQ